MHFERDAIHEKVQPALSALADQYGESISFCDLRWGVNTEDLDSEEGYMKSRQLRVTIVEESSTAQAERQLAWAYNDAGEAYGALEQDAGKLTALNRFEKCIPIFEEDLKQNENLNKVWNLANTYKQCVKLLGQYKDIDSLKKIEKYAHRALELYEYRAKKENIELGYMIWMDMLQVYESLTNNRAEKRKCLETMVQVSDVLYAMTKKRDYKKMSAVYKLSLASENVMKKL